MWNFFYFVKWKYNTSRICTCNFRAKFRILSKLEPNWSSLGTRFGHLERRDLLDTNGTSQTNTILRAADATNFKVGFINGMPYLNCKHPSCGFNSKPTTFYLLSFEILNAPFLVTLFSILAPYRLFKNYLTDLLHILRTYCLYIHLQYEWKYLWKLQTKGAFFAAKFNEKFFFKHVPSFFRFSFFSNFRWYKAWY